MFFLLLSLIVPIIPSIIIVSLPISSVLNLSHILVESIDVHLMPSISYIIKFSLMNIFTLFLLFYEALRLS